MGINGNTWTASFILKILRLHNELWRFRCDIVHAKIMGNEYIESIVWLRAQIMDALLSNDGTLHSSLTTSEEEILLMNASQLRGWLYQYYADTQQWTKYDDIHNRALQGHKRRRLDLDAASLALRVKLFADLEPD